MRVVYFPGHAEGDYDHEDSEHGTVSSKNHINAFVRFDKQVAKLGWDGATSQSCCPADLAPEKHQRHIVCKICHTYFNPLPLQENAICQKCAARTLRRNAE
jgi:hypothetical protein